MKQEHYLWQLFNIEKDITKANEDLEGEQRIRKEIVDELGNYESETSKKKKVQSGYLKEIAQCERRIAEKKTKLDKNVRVYPSLLFFVYPCCVYIYESSPPLLPCYLHAFAESISRKFTGKHMFLCQDSCKFISL